MTVHPIRLLPDPVLRQRAKRVPEIDASTHRLIEDMIESMYSGLGRPARAACADGRSRCWALVLGVPEKKRATSGRRREMQF